MKTTPFVLLSLLGGAIVPIQIAITHALRGNTGASQIQATFYLYFGGMIGSLLITYVVNGSALPPVPEKSAWWMWISGFIGLFYMLFMFISAPHIGAATTLVWIFIGQALIATLIDHFGLIGMPIKPTTWLKITGIALIAIGGVLLVMNENLSQ